MPRAGHPLPIVYAQPPKRLLCCHAFPLAACFACSPVSYLPTSRCPCHTLYSSRPPCRVRLIIQSPLAIASALSRRHFTATSSMPPPRDRKSTRLNSSHVRTSYAVFCLK